MTNTRRVFLTQLTVLTGSAMVSSPLTGLAKTFNHSNLLSPDGSLAIYYSNELNGYAGAVYEGLGGLAHLNTLLKNSRQKGLVLNAGGFLSDSKGAMAQAGVISLMNAAGYHAAGITNKELVGGHEKFAELASRINFSLVNCNHEFTGSLKRIIKPYIIINTGNIKIGITGVSEKLDHISYKDPIQSANNTASYLKKQAGCNLVVCLSGFTGTENLKFIEQSNDIDIILGQGKNITTGNILTMQNLAKQEAMLASAAANGLTIGKLDISFNSAGQKNRMEGKNIVPGAPAGQPEAAAVAYISKVKRKIAIA